MPLSADQARDIAARFDAAETSRTQMRQVSLDYPDIVIADSYAIQSEWVKLKTARGQKIVGHKIGLTSRAMQRAANIEEPDYGVLMDEMMYASGDEIPYSRFIEPRIEVELAFMLDKPLSGPDCTPQQVLDATAYITPALEIIDARVHRIDPETGKTRRVFDTIADNAANVGVIVGGKQVKPREVDLRWVAAILLRNGVVEESGVAAAVLNDPANGPAWLANKLHPHGVTLQPGQLILGGSFTAPVPIARGDVFAVDYGPLGVIEARFV